MLKTKWRVPRPADGPQPVDYLRPGRRANLIFILLPAAWNPEAVRAVGRTCADAPAGVPCPCAALGLL